MPQLLWRLLSSESPWPPPAVLFNISLLYCDAWRSLQCSPATHRPTQSLSTCPLNAPLHEEVPRFWAWTCQGPPGMLKFAVAHGRLWSTLMIVTIMSQLPCSVALRKSCVWLVWVASVYPTKPTREIKPLVSVDNDLMWRAQNLRNTWGSTVEGNYSHCKDIVTSVMVPQLKSTGLPTTVARPGFPVSFGACMHHLHCHGLWPSPAELCWQLPHQALSPCPTG